MRMYRAGASERQVPRIEGWTGPRRSRAGGQAHAHGEGVVKHSRTSGVVQARIEDADKGNKLDRDGEKSSSMDSQC
jgi:hypothetical protein